MKKILFVILLSAVTMASFADKKEKTDEVKRPETESFNYQRAIEALNANNLDEAISYFSKELQENKQNGYAFAMRGDAKCKKGDSGDALMDYNKALKYLPSKDKEFVSATQCARGNVYLSMGDTIKGLADVNAAIELSPDNIDLLERRGQLYYEQSKYDLSDKDYESIMKINDGYFMAYMGLGRNCYERKEYDKAIEYYNKVVSLYKDYDSGYSFRADAYLQKKEWAKAADDIISSLAINQDRKAYYLMLDDNKPFYPVMLAKLKVKLVKEGSNADWHYNLGSFYEHHGKYHLAIESYKKCSELDQQAYYLERISECYSEMGEMENALEYVNMAQDLDSTDTDLIAEKADILYYQHKTKEAIAELDRYVEKSPDNAGGYYRRGFYKDNANLVDEAIEDYTMAISLDPTYTYSYLGRGDQYMKQEQKELANADYQKVIDADTIPSSNPLRAYAYLAIGEKAKGKQFLDSCLAKCPTDAGLKYDAACFCSRSGEIKQAVEYLDSAFQLGYRKFAHLDMDDDMDNIRNTPEYKALVAKYKKIMEAETDSKSSLESYHEEVYEIPFTREYSNTCTVKCSINELPLSFVFDTGASDVSISQVEATFMMKNGYLNKNDIVGKQYYSDANGNINEGTEINLKKVNFGGVELNNVKASVVKNQKAPLLLGQTVFKRLGKIEIDNGKRVLKVTRKVK